MVKAQKRKDPSSKGPDKLKRDKPFAEKYGKAIILITLALIVAGFTLQGPMSSGNINRRAAADQAGQEQIDQTPDYGIGIETGQEEGIVGSVTKNNALFGQLEVPISLNTALEGDLYVLDKGATQLILTSASKETIEKSAKGSYIIYDVASCGDFDCMITDDVNGSTVFDTYELDEGSEFLSTNKIGFPAQLT